MSGGASLGARHRFVFSQQGAGNKSNKSNRAYKSYKPYNVDK